MKLDRPGIVVLSFLAGIIGSGGCTSGCPDPGESAFLQSGSPLKMTNTLTLPGGQTETVAYELNINAPEQGSARTLPPGAPLLLVMRLTEGGSTQDMTFDFDPMTGAPQSVTAVGMRDPATTGSASATLTIEVLSRAGLPEIVTGASVVLQLRVKGMVSFNTGAHFPMAETDDLAGTWSVQRWSSCK